MKYALATAVQDCASGASAVEASSAALSGKKQRTLWGDAFRRLRRNKIAIVSLVWILFVVVLAVSADLWVPNVLGDPTIPSSDSLAAPSAVHPFGTDLLGRDVLAVFGAGFQNVFIAIGILGWPQIARVFRSAILSVKENDYIDAARAMGASDVRIIVRHIFPNSVATIIVYATMSIGGAILTESALSFLGMGVQPPTPSWGYMISDGKTYMNNASWLMICPGFAILSTVLAFTMLGDGLRDALDVKTKDV